jgi:hypothetical protein
MCVCIVEEMEGCNRIWGDKRDLRWNPSLVILKLVDVGKSQTVLQLFPICKVGINNSYFLWMLLKLK